ncbi:signal peptidase II [Nocardiopsis alborubida]|uniref:Lipoprotein signal peptidase n=1 Tax=Nocardiopsis alborubida TaxID=146802 RepID=A0A7X6M9J7_9ACTN|nr:signal peptidase II [Nocardiopsis alborubida]NKY96662.1 signal peptidase II [Nocardiopsis alborubida]
MPTAPATAGTLPRWGVLAVALALTAADLALKALAEDRLTGGPGPQLLGLLELRLTYNPGVAFSLGASMPAWVIVAVTGLITAALAAYAWYIAPAAPPLGRVGLAGMLGGALANLIDRGLDGVVTDYLHSGWWPTFNLADAFIVGGAVLLVLTSARHRAPESMQRGKTP